MARERRQFSAEFKIEAVRLAESGKAPGAVARQLGVRADLLRKWRQQFAGAAGASDAFPGRGKVSRARTKRSASSGAKSRSSRRSATS